jgi:uncharacterized protein
MLDTSRHLTIAFGSLVALVAIATIARPLLVSWPDVAVIGVGAGLSLAVFAGIPWLLARPAGGIQASYRWRPAGADLRWAVGGWLITLATVWVLSVAHEQVTGAPAAGNAGVGPDLVNKIAMAAAVVVVAPIVEELFFRGLLLEALRQRVGATLAVIISSAIFGALHLTAFDANGIFVVAATGTLGLVAAVMTLRTGRLGAAIALHMLFNASTMLALLLS